MLTSQQGTDMSLQVGEILDLNPGLQVDSLVVTGTVPYATIEPPHVVAQIFLTSWSGLMYGTVTGSYFYAPLFCISIYFDTPTTRSHHQIVNFLRFAELLVKKCPNLSRLRLVTSPAADGAGGGEPEQAAKLRELAASLAARHKVTLALEFSASLHDREIRLDTGWVVKIGRGLDFFQPPAGKMVIGYFEMEHRPCLETTVDIFFKKKS